MDSEFKNSSVSTLSLSILHLTWNDDNKIKSCSTRFGALIIVPYKIIQMHPRDADGNIFKYFYVEEDYPHVPSELLNPIISNVGMAT